MENRSYMLKSTFKQLCKKLHYLATEKATEVKKNLKEAKSGGSGMHDNAAYEHMLLEENRLANEIMRLSRKLENVVFIEDLKIDVNRVGLGMMVKISRIERGEKMVETYTILGPDEVDVDRNIISYLSPIGKALMRKRIGEEVEITIPSGKMIKTKILDIRKREY